MFSLRLTDLGHQGGLNAAVPGPAFVCNTADGTVRSAAAHKPLAQSAGRHTLIGIFDCGHVKLFVDGELVAERQSDAHSELAAVGHNARIEVGHIARACQVGAGVTVADVAIFAGLALYPDAIEQMQSWKRRRSNKLLRAQRLTARL